jgi:hypothetical protein
VAFNDPVDTLPASAITGQIQGSQLAADSIDGKTITGALIRTGTAPAARLEMGPVALGVPQLTGYTGDTRESTPGELAFTRPSHAQLAGDQLELQLSAGVYPIGGGAPAWSCCRKRSTEVFSARPACRHPPCRSPASAASCCPAPCKSSTGTCLSLVRTDRIQERGNVGLTLE